MIWFHRDIKLRSQSSSGRQWRRQDHLQPEESLGEEKVDVIGDGDCDGDQENKLLSDIFWHFHLFFIYDRKSFRDPQKIEMFLMPRHEGMKALKATI